jgi:hypothetical protein
MPDPNDPKTFEHSQLDERMSDVKETHAVPRCRYEGAGEVRPGSKPRTGGAGYANTAAQRSSEDQLR